MRTTPPPTKSDFSQRIAIITKLAGTGQELANRAGISRRVIGKYLAGESDPSRERLVAMADAAGVSVNWLATGEGPMRTPQRTNQAMPRPTPESEMLVKALEVIREQILLLTGEELPQTTRRKLHPMALWLADALAGTNSAQRQRMERIFKRAFPDYTDESGREEEGLERELARSVRRIIPRRPTTTEIEA